MIASTLQHDDVEYVSPTDEELISITFLDQLATKLGNPPDVSSESGLKLMDAVIGVWQKHCPQEVADWMHDQTLMKETEKSLQELNAENTGLYNPASYPPILFALIRAIFPGIKLQAKEVWSILIKTYPGLFKSSKYA